MKKVIVLMLALCFTVLSCKKDEDKTNVSLTVKAKLQSETSFKPGVTVKVYRGTGGGQLVTEGITDVNGQIVFADLTTGDHTITGNFTNANNDNCSASYNLSLNDGSNFIEVVLTCGSDTTDICANVPCGEFGTLTETSTTCTCVCTNGFEGTDCNTPSRDKFVGSFSVNEVCPSGSASYIATITPSAQYINVFDINNFGDYAPSISVRAMADGNEFTLPNQAFNNGNLTITGGSGVTTNSGGVISISYSYILNGVSENCNAVYTRQ